MTLVAFFGVNDRLKRFSPSLFAGADVSNGMLLDVLADAALLVLAAWM
jgi:hypothetical protein